MNSYIELKDICKDFAGVHALKNVSIDVRSGEVHSIVGENGAGKSTLIKVMSGFHQPTSGECYVKGEKVVIENPGVAIGLGIGVVYQELNVVDSLSVAENIYFGRLPRKKFGIVDWKKLYKDAEDILKRINLNIPVETKVGTLGTAQKQLVEIARCVSQNPNFIIMDEPTSSLAPNEIQKVLEVIKILKKQNVAILYISHKLNEVFAISDRITVIRDGEYVGTKEASEIDEKGLIALMVGRTLTQERTRKCCATEDISLKVENLSTDCVRDVNFYVKKGEIVGFNGLMGAGRTELAKALYGFDSRTSGKIILDGVDVPSNNTVKSMKLGFGYIPESRKEEGIFQNFNILQNITISSMNENSKFGVIQKKNESNISEEYKNKLRIKTPSINQMIVNLSGGNQQKVIIARWLAKTGLKVLIVDEPTRGIDVGAKSEIYDLLDDLAQMGLSIIVMSSEMQEILNICDRIYVMKKGRISAEFNIDEVTQEKLLASAI